MTSPTPPVTTPKYPEDTPGVPVFGRRTSPMRYRQFDLEVTETRGREEVAETLRFECYEEPDTGSIMAMLQASNAGSQGAAVMRVLGAVLRDNDGVSLQYVQPTDPIPNPEWDEDDADRLGDDYDASPWLLEEVEVDPATDGEDGQEQATTEILALWEGPDGPTTNVDDLVVEFEEGSSRRRFGLLVNDPTRRIEFSALQQIAEWMVKEVTDRPTKQPRPSRSGGRPTGRGASARRPARA